MTTRQETEALMEQVTSAWRPRDIDGGPRPHPAWHDLDEAGREQAYEETARLRALEAGIDPRGLSSTGRAVLARIARR